MRSPRDRTDRRFQAQWVLAALATVLSCQTGNELAPEPVLNAPTATTGAATAITANEAQLNGSVNPNEQATSVMFEWSTSPTLNGASTTARQALVPSSTPSDVSTPLTGLAASTPFYYRIIATSAGGNAAGSIQSFTTASGAPPGPTGPPPTIAVLAPSDTGAYHGIAMGTANPNGFATLAWFEYGTSPSLSGSSSTTEQSVGSLFSPVSVSGVFYLLSANTTHYYRVVARNAHGTVFSDVLSFVTKASPPSIPASPQVGTVNTSDNEIRVDLNPRSAFLGRRFELQNHDWSTSAWTMLATVDRPAFQYRHTVTPLVPQYYRARECNDLGCSDYSAEAFGIGASGSENLAPSVRTEPARQIGSSMTMIGRVVAGRRNATVSFEASSSPDMSSPTTFSVGDVPPGYSPLEREAELTGVPSGQTRYYRFVATNSIGTARGVVLSVTAP